ncbi:MAG: hypothetical protein KC462_04450, partial [Cyanobacteria bacterium HKST-UBA05]|nr:hypothetical protein [Cyanobacteria bacterium HKST-UBA05]
TGQINIDPGGQAQLFNIEDVLVPEGLENLAGFFNNRLKRTEEKLDKVSAQNERLANSLETVIPKFLDQSVNNVQRDIVFGQLKYGEKADVAIADEMKVASETLYSYSAGELAEKIGNENITPQRMGLILRALGIYGDPQFHHEYSISKKTRCQKYKQSTIDEIYRRLQNPKQYGLDVFEVAKAANFIKPQGT